MGLNNGMKIITWNMDYWKRNNTQRKAGWSYLTKELNPNIALLQETRPLVLFDEVYDIYYRGSEQKTDWGTAILAKKYPYFEQHFKSYYKGSEGLTCFDFKISDEITLTAINIYGKIDSKGYVTTTIHHMLSDLTPILQERRKRCIVIGGDLNVSLQWDEKYPGQDPSHKITFDRFEDFGMINCTKKMFKGHVRTQVHPKTHFPWQNDYIFVNKNLEDLLIGCKVHNDEKLLEYSDHYPVETELDIKA
ncbi:MAG: hypothetical protein COA82_08280 [Alkaliphilus sp.]|nr:MAG: hypothetical protein COA82_08280 [Alkaliphilus sp.]